MKEKEKKSLLFIVLSTILLILASLLPLTQTLRFILYGIAYLLVGANILYKAFRNLIHGKLLDENFLMSIATISAFLIGEYLEGVLVMLLYQIGELFQSYAVGKSRKSITELMNIRAEYANLKIGNKMEKVDPETVKVGDTIVVKVGEKIPLDGVIKEGDSFLDTSALSGEAVPKRVKEKDMVLSGCINKTSLLTIEVTKEYENSTVAKILDLIENASTKKAKAENFITKFAHYYTPTVVFLAILLATFPPLFTDITLVESIRRAMTFLVISCPCALVISIPLGFFGGIGRASKQGILIKGSNYLETLAKTQTMVFDKTGTLTHGTFEVIEINSQGENKETLLEIAALAEIYSNHPIATSIKNAYKNSLDTKRVKDIKETAGLGITARIDNKHIALGNQKLMEKIGCPIPVEKAEGTLVHMAINKKYAGSILIADKIKEEAKDAIQKMREKNHIEEIIMLSGDNTPTAKAVSQKLGLDDFYAELLPDDKVNKIEQLLKTKKRPLAFVGDGINDAPSLTRSDIGIAMGQLGSDAAMEAADIVIMDDNLAKINTAIAISQKTLAIVKQNIVFALGIKLFFLILGAFGLSNMMEAVFADVGVSILAILNSMRLLYTKKNC